MTIARKFTLALLAFVVVAVTAYAIVAARDELAQSESDIVEHESSTDRATLYRELDRWSQAARQSGEISRILRHAAIR
jgi:hypothetical protein